MSLAAFYNEFYARAEASQAHARFCERVYGMNLCQHGMADLAQLELLVSGLEVAAVDHVLDVGCGTGHITEYLCQKTTVALEVNDTGLALGYLKKQKRFLEEHLVVWVPAFCKDVQRIGRGDFYRAIAKLTTGYLRMEQELIGELVSEIKEG